MRIKTKMENENAITLDGVEYIAVAKTSVGYDVTPCTECDFVFDRKCDCVQCFKEHRSDRRDVVWVKKKKQKITKADKIKKWWAQGWNIRPRNLQELSCSLMELYIAYHDAWVEAMRSGEVPVGKVSPGDGFFTCVELVDDAIARIEALEKKGKKAKKGKKE